MDGVKVLEINDDLDVIYTLPNHLKMVVDFDGNRQEKFLCQDIEPMYYNSDNRDKEGNIIEERKLSIALGCQTAMRGYAKLMETLSPSRYIGL